MCPQSAGAAKQLPGGPCSKCGRSIKWYAAGTQCMACYMAEQRERKRRAQQAEQKGSMLHGRAEGEEAQGAAG